MFTSITFVMRKKVFFMIMIKVHKIFLFICIRYSCIANGDIAIYIVKQKKYFE